MFVRTPYNFIKNNPECGIKLKILYFALEESKEEFIDSLISARLSEEHGINVSTVDLRGMGEKPISSTVLDKIKESQEYFKDLYDSLEVVDSISNPTGLYKYARNYSVENGEHYFKPLPGKDLKQLNYKEYNSLDDPQKANYRYSHYEQNDPNEYVIVITDHISLLSEERDGKLGVTLNKHQSISKWSAEYCRKQMTKHWKYTVVNVQQQSSDVEKQQYTFKGNSIQDKLEPSLSGLGDNKLTQRDALVVIGLFAPHRYGITKHNGHKVSDLSDNYRSLSVIKNRIGRSDLQIGLLFNGATNHFEELPHHDDVKKLNNTLNIVKGWRKIQ